MLVLLFQKILVMTTFLFQTKRDYRKDNVALSDLKCNYILNQNLLVTLARNFKLSAIVKITFKIHAYFRRKK